MSNVAGKAYGMNVITPMKPWKTWINTLIFRVGRLTPDTLTGLLGLSLIHFARWVMIRRDQWPDLGQGPQQLDNDYMLFCSNFNGTWDQYIDAFSDGIPNGLDLFWYSSTGYPHSVPITPFKDYILHNQVDTSYYYDATPGSAQRDIKAALRVLPVVRELSRQHGQQNPAEFAASWRRALIQVQNDLGTPGYAPVASNDTREADWNREPAVHRAIAERAARPAQAIPPCQPAPAPKPRPDNTTSYDGGHYFLTLLIPVQNQHLVEHYGIQCSAVQRLRDVLATLPTALQSKATESIGLNSPFARTRRTHLARLVVINDVQYNGREGEDAIIGALKKTSLTTPQAQDRLSCPFLLFAADFDAADDSVASVHGYLGELWQSMEPELRAVLENCYGYERIRDASTFCDYMLACEVETTMPFNDYWPGAPPLKNRIREAILPPLIPAAGALAVLIGGLLTGVLALLGYLSDALAAWLAPCIHLLAPKTWCLLIPAALAVLGASLYWGVKRTLAVGGQPFPAAPNSDLRSVLKALYLQQHLVRFAIDAQGLDDTTLHTRFAAFIRHHQPTELDEPTQPPGVVRSPAIVGDLS